MRKCNDEIYQLAKDQAPVKKLKNKRFRLFCLCPPNIKYKVQDYDLRHDNWWSRDYFSNQITDTDEACRSSEISVNLIIIIVFL
jgi:hypothetical protein